MKKIAYVLVTKKGRPVGFLTGRQATEKISAGEADKPEAEVREVEENNS